jgi:hypothetical protein
MAGPPRLICYGACHVLHHVPAHQPLPRDVVGLIEQQTGEWVYSIATLTPLAGDPSGVFGRLARSPRGIVIPANGTRLGAVNAGDLRSPVIGPGLSGQPVNLNCGVP